MTNRFYRLNGCALRTNVDKMVLEAAEILKYFIICLSFVPLGNASTQTMNPFSIRLCPTVRRIAAPAIVMMCCLLLLGCQTEQTRIPDCAVYLRRNINNAGLLSPGKYLYVKTPLLDSDRLGFGGLIVIYSYDELEPYCAFDLACPNCVSPSIRISEPNDQLVCTCPECGERYDLFHGLGVPLRGISKVGLKKYTAYIDPFNNFYIIVVP